MLVQLKLGEIRLLIEGLRKIVDKPLPVKTAYRLSKIIRIVNDEFTDFETARGKLVRKHSKEGEEEGSPAEVKVDPEKQQQFFEEFNTLLGEEIEIDINLISLEDLGDISLTAADMFSLQKIIKEDEEKVEEKKE